MNMLLTGPFIILGLLRLRLSQGLKSSRCQTVMESRPLAPRALCPVQSSVSYHVLKPRLQGRQDALASVGTHFLVWHPAPTPEPTSSHFQVWHPAPTPEPAGSHFQVWHPAPTPEPAGSHFQVWLLLQNLQVLTSKCDILYLLQNLYDVRRDHPTRCPLTSTSAIWHVCIPPSHIDNKCDLKKRETPGGGGSCL